jgi:hypothetical protein
MTSSKLRIGRVEREAVARMAAEETDGRPSVTPNGFGKPRLIGRRQEIRRTKGILARDGFEAIYDNHRSGAAQAAACQDSPNLRTPAACRAETPHHFHVHLRDERSQQTDGNGSVRHTPVEIRPGFAIGHCPNRIG